MRQALRQFDRSITTWLYQRPARLIQVYEWITLLGHPAVVVFIGVLVVVMSLGLGNHQVAMIFMIGLVALAMGSSLKLVLRRPRPATPYAARMNQHSFSFPSGHTYGVALIYGLGILEALNSFISPWGEVFAIILLPVIVLVGLSRVYLGAHYFLDVIGGWILAIPMLLLINYFWL